MSSRENSLWITKVMGHRNTEMVIKVYSKYIENAAGFSDGAAFNEVIQVSKGNQNEA